MQSCANNPSAVDRLQYDRFVLEMYVRDYTIYLDAEHLCVMSANDYEPTFDDGPDYVDHRKAYGAWARHWMCWEVIVQSCECTALFTMTCRSWLLLRYTAVESISLWFSNCITYYPRISCRGPDWLNFLASAFSLTSYFWGPLLLNKKSTWERRYYTRSENAAHFRGAIVSIFTPIYRLVGRSLMLSLCLDGKNLNVPLCYVYRHRLVIAFYSSFFLVLPDKIYHVELRFKSVFNIMSLILSVLLGSLPGLNQSFLGVQNTVTKGFLLLITGRVPVLVVVFGLFNILRLWSFRCKLAHLAYYRSAT